MELLFISCKYSVETFVRRKILLQIEAKSDEKPQFITVNEDFEEDFNEKLK